MIGLIRIATLLFVVVGAAAAQAQVVGLADIEDDRAKSVGHAMALLDLCGQEIKDDEFEHVLKVKYFKGYTIDQIKYLAILAEMSRRMRRDLTVDYQCDDPALAGARKEIDSWMAQAPVKN